MKEIWKDIKGYEDLYQISNYGNVKALYREVTNKNGKIQKYPEKLLKQEVIKREHTNYRRVTLSKEHKVTRYQVHRLVALHFIPNPDNKCCINHIDNNGENNIVTNLEWATHSENMLHAQKQNRLFESQSKGGKNGGISSERSLNKALSLVGSIINDWKVISYYGRKGKKNDHYVTCECLLCGKTYEVNVQSLLHNRTSRCRSCGLKFSYKKSVR